MKTLDEAAFNYVDLKLTETKDRECLPSNFFAADVEKAFKAGANWMKQQILNLVDDRITENCANEGNSAGGRLYKAKLDEDVKIYGNVKKL